MDMHRIFVAAVMFILLAVVAQAARANYNYSNGYSLDITSSIINFINFVINSILSALSMHQTTTATTTQTTTVVHTTSTFTTLSSTTSTTTIPSTAPTTSVSTVSTVPTTTIYSTSTTATTTSTIPQGQLICKADNYLKDNESISCSNVTLTLVDVVMGNQRYEISNALVDVYLNGNIQFMNLSLPQNFTTPYQLNFTNGQYVNIYVYEAFYSYYPLYRYANLSISYYG